MESTEGLEDETHLLCRGKEDQGLVLQMRFDERPEYIGFGLESAESVVLLKASREF
jgi:hypothetical protein